MNTRIVTVSGTAADRDKIKMAGDIIKAGGLVAFPTETVYGLGGDALNAQSAGRIYAAKGRPADNPLIIHIGRIEDLPVIAEKVPEAAYSLAKHFWPGPLTMIFNKTAIVPAGTTGGLDTVAVRVPAHPAALALIEAAGGFVAAPSANLSGRPSPTLARYVIEDLAGRIDMILDGGEVEIGMESTILDLTGAAPVILRPGFITDTMLAEVLDNCAAGRMLTNRVNAADGADQAEYNNAAKVSGSSGHEAIKADGITKASHVKAIIYNADKFNEAAEINETTEKKEAAEINEAPPKAPGMKYRHYAPQGQLTVVEGPEDEVVAYINSKIAEARTAGKKTGVIGTAATAGRYLADSVKNAGRREDEAFVARQLFRILREFDDEKVTVIYSEAFPESGVGQAVMNRLLKAAGHRIVHI